jgi:hypothetical protein
MKEYPVIGSGSLSAGSDDRRGPPELEFPVALQYLEMQH